MLIYTSSPPHWFDSCSHWLLSRPRFYFWIILWIEMHSWVSSNSPGFWLLTCCLHLKLEKVGCTGPKVWKSGTRQTLPPSCPIIDHRTFTGMNERLIQNPAAHTSSRYDRDAGMIKAPSADRAFLSSNECVLTFLDVYFQARSFSGDISKRVRSQQPEIYSSVENDWIMLDIFY